MFPLFLGITTSLYSMQAAKQESFKGDMARFVSLCNELKAPECQNKDAKVRDAIALRTKIVDQYQSFLQAKDYGILYFS